MEKIQEKKLHHVITKLKKKTIHRKKHLSSNVAKY